jgi:phage shock protein C
MSEQKRLLRVTEGRWLGGVCLGLARYLSIDVVFIRLAFALLAMNGLGVLVYIILWIVIPADTRSEAASGAAFDPGPGINAAMHDIGQAISGERGAVLGGLLLVVVGGLLLGSRFMPMINLSLLWPLMLIGLGGFILVRGR